MSADETQKPGAASFDAVAEVYATARPSYPREAVDFLVDASAKVVADVGAGTGLFTRMLPAPGRAVIAVEPSTPMLDVLRRAIPDVVAHEGSGEGMPLDDASVDVVTFAQAWHWVDSAGGSAEAARVLRPGGALGLVWNLRDERTGWVRALGEAMRADGDHFRGEVEDPDVREPFGEPERHRHEWVREVTREELIDDVRSRSYFALLSAWEQAGVVDAVRTVLDGHEETRDRKVLAIPYVTASFRYRLA